ncbi:hypothetical protein DDP37_07500 [Helicobacter pylori]|nr:hypothetical protein DDP37_07500 [Helicobacter pylori]
MVFVVFALLGHATCKFFAFLFVKRLFLAVVFSYSNTPPTPQDSSTLKLSLSLSLSLSLL